MKYFLTFFISILLFKTISAQLPPESDPHRGMYIDRFMNMRINNSSIVDPVFSILSVDTNCDGIFEKEDAYLNYACQNHITYLALYDLGKILGQHKTAWNENTRQYEDLEKHLCRFIEKAKHEYGVTQIGAVGGSLNSFDSIAAFMDRFPVTNPYRIRREIKNSPYYNSELDIVERPATNAADQHKSELYKLGLRLNDFNSCNCQADIDVLNIEYEYWSNCVAELPAFISMMQAIYSIKQIHNAAHPNNPLMTEAYIAFLPYCTNPGEAETVEVMDGCKNCSPFAGCPNPNPRMIDRILYTLTVANPNSFGYSDVDLFETPQSYDSTDFHPMLYAESAVNGGVYDFLGPWLAAAPQNTIFIAEDYFWYGWLRFSTSALGQPRMNNIQDGGVHWFTGSFMVGHLDNPKVVFNYGPFCAVNDSAKIILYYAGADEPGTDYNFWITRDNDSSVVYPRNGGMFTGVTHWTVNNPGYRAIDFMDTTSFPPCYLQKGKYTSHIILNYNHSTGCTYSSDFPIIVDDKPHLQITGDSVICHGSQTYLITNDSASWYAWYRNGSLYMYSYSNQLNVTEDGYYYCQVNGGQCTSYTDTVHISVKPLPNAFVNATCNGNGTVTLKTNLFPANSSNTATSGLGGVTYQWNTGETTDQITVNAPSSKKVYRVLITDPYSGCNVYRDINLPAPLDTTYSGVITVNSQPTTSCSNDGSITASLTPAPGTYDPISYLWSNGATTAVITNLAPGTYSVAMSNYKLACSSYATVTIGTPSPNVPTLNQVVSPAHCNNTSDGSIILSPAGGNPPFTFSWDYIPEENGYSSSSQNLNNLFPGVYELTVTDSSGCKFSFFYTVGKSDGPIIVTPNVVVPVSGCSTNQNGSATFHATGASLPISESWTDISGQTFNNGNNLHAGSYRLTITDHSGCTGSTFINVPNNNLAIDADILDSSRTIVSCDSVNDGRLYLCVHGGRAPYTASSPWIVDTNLIYMENLSPGMYPVIITDSGNCVMTDTFYVEPSDLNLLISPVNTSCIGCANGKILLTYNGGEPPYSISWTPSIGNLSGDTIVQLPAGNYSACISDSNLCSICFSAIILDDPLFVKDAGTNDGIVISPNPSRGIFSVKVETPVKEKLFLEMVDVYGRNVSGHSFYSNEKIEINNENLSNGIYILVVKNENSKTISFKKIIISH